MYEKKMDKTFTTVCSHNKFADRLRGCIRRFAIHDDS